MGCKVVGGPGACSPGKFGKISPLKRLEMLLKSSKVNQFMVLYVLKSEEPRRLAGSNIKNVFLSQLRSSEFLSLFVPALGF